MTSSELILLPSLKATRGDNGGLVLTRKYLEGAAEYARTWPGPVTSLVALSDQPTGDMDRIEIQPKACETGLELRPAGEKEFAQRIANAALVLPLLAPWEARTSLLCDKLGVPVVFVSEFTPETERQILWSEVSNPLLRLRRRLWLDWAERVRLRILPLAAGLQCSGTPTFDHYRKWQPNTLLFFDNRVRRAEVIGQDGLTAKAATLRARAPLRLVFGGRLIAMKGVMDLPEIAAALMAQGVAFTLDIYGSGPLEEKLSARIAALGLSDRVRLQGARDFRTGWIPALQREADLFLCPHPQGDPSSTYSEVMSCGVPIAGYANEAFEGIVRESGAGWLSPLGDPAALAACVARLDNARDEIIAAGARARDFATEHSFEATYKNRSTHLIAASRLPETL